ncbi:MAG: succinate dehydrogenase/fumarate reductase iron-sulfur subunit, partial [Candidatus Heimdallarchaeota archaeon]|nr:succinate dehydrogenase/fumarate reductase iron-sulfur subunit [Candidatus Heimdallarchaeota archaeon]MCK4878486.1 succinate dehydrogenase/fumarate reductase iron-sulfur subunit [Candidatus Heimdallarchaeota archaeon]
MSETQGFLVYRKSPDDKEPRYERYEVPLTKRMTILDALFYIQDHIDSSLAFRYSCRGAICGSCSITVDKVPMLACRTQVSSVKTSKKPSKLPKFDFSKDLDWDKESEILIEPLPNMKVEKDLVVNMKPFWRFYKEVRPFFTKKWKDIQPEKKQKMKEANAIEHLVYCILCGLCWSCPVNAKNEEYLGPAQLAKSYRFISDTRVTSKPRKAILERVSKKDAVPACEQYFVCNRV